MISGCERVTALMTTHACEPRHRSINSGTAGLAVADSTSLCFIDEAQGLCA
jgi:hypothetical protein